MGKAGESLSEQTGPGRTPKNIQAMMKSIIRGPSFSLGPD
jgi:hypothetical protein